MNLLQIFLLGLDIYLAKTGTFSAVVNGNREYVTVTEVGSAKPLGSFTFEEALVIAEAVLTNTGTTFNVDVGADEYSVVISSTPPA